MFKVIKDFADSEDKGYIYRNGDMYPRAGDASPKRIQELSTSGNRLGIPLIAEVQEKPKKKRKSEE